MSEREILGTNLTPDDVYDELEEVGRILCDLDTFLDFRTSLEDGALGIEDVSGIAPIWQEIGQWLDAMDASVR